MKITIVVCSVPENTPARDNIYVIGNFNHWRIFQSNSLMRKHPDGTYTIDIECTEPRIEFKLTRGNWEQVEGNVDGTKAQNHIFACDKDKTVYVDVLSWEDLYVTPPIHTISTNVHIISEAFIIPELKRLRRIWIYLPPDYKTTKKRYPVIYMQDGQNLFDEYTAYQNEWRIDKTLNKLFKEGHRGAIVVGIDNGAEFRTEEYVPFSDYGVPQTRGDFYAQFIVNTLKPYIDQNYRTFKNAQNTGIIGSSYGGLFSFYAGLKYNNVFGRIGVLSPIFKITNQLQEFIQNIKKRKDTQLYFVASATEGTEMLNNMKKVYDYLKVIDFPEENLNLVIKSDGGHNEDFWGREFQNAFGWLFMR